MGPLFSICVPTYNRGSLLDDFLGRLRDFERFCEPFEVVVSDNASTDGTAQVLDIAATRRCHTCGPFGRLRLWSRCRISLTLCGMG